MVEFGRFGILADGRPIRLGARAFDVLMRLPSLIEDRARATSGCRFLCHQSETLEHVHQRTAVPACESL